jgi:hypothetical protein
LPVAKKENSRRQEKTKIFSIGLFFLKNLKSVAHLIFFCKKISMHKSAIVGSNSAQILTGNNRLIQELKIAIITSPAKKLNMIVSVPITPAFLL